MDTDGGKFLPLKAKQMTRSTRNPNYQALVLVFTPGDPHSIAEYTIEQEVRTEKRHLEVANRQVTETLEGLRDRLGLDYQVYLPTNHTSMSWRIANRVFTIAA